MVTTIPESLAFPMDWLARLKLWKQGKRVAVPYDDARVERWKSLTACRGRYSAPNVLPHTDLALLQYTGGTTGTAKGCMISHANLVANTEQIKAILFDVGSQPEVFLGILPYRNNFV